MRRFDFMWLLAIAMGLFVAQAVHAEEPKTFGDWGYECDEPGGGQPGLCFMFQNVSKKEGGQLVLGARIAYKPGESNPLLVVTVPLGSLLPPGAALTMEGIDPVQMQYFICAAEGCTTIATPIPPAMIEAMKKGTQAIVRVAAPSQQVIGLPLSLNGFTKALAALK